MAGYAQAQGALLKMAALFGCVQAQLQDRGLSLLRFFFILLILKEESGHILTCCWTELWRCVDRIAGPSDGLNLRVLSAPGYQRRTSPPLLDRPETDDYLVYTCK